MAYSKMVEIHDNPEILIKPQTFECTTIFQQSSVEQPPCSASSNQFRVEEVVQKARTPLQRGLIFELMETPNAKESARSEAEAELAELAETADLALKVLLCQSAGEVRSVTLE